jgi:homoaconitase/3-isopropylmalate dehydratase large subunit
MAIDDRMTLCNHAAELGAKAAILEADEKTFAEEEQAVEMIKLGPSIPRRSRTKDARDETLCEPE